MLSYLYRFVFEDMDDAILLLFAISTCCHRPPCRRRSSGSIVIDSPVSAGSSLASQVGYSTIHSELQLLEILVNCMLLSAFLFFRFYFRFN